MDWERLKYFQRIASRFISQIAILAFGAAILLSTETKAASKNANVYIDSVANDAYVTRKDGADEVNLETYMFFEGRFFGGKTKDASISKVSFNDLILSLAENMKDRNYYPAVKREDADLLVVVHWGVTGTDDDFRELLAYEDPGVTDYSELGGSGNPDGSIGGAGVQSDPMPYEGLIAHGGTAYGDGINAELLGFERVLNRNELSKADRYTLKYELREERYFIILMAYDYPTMREGGGNKLLWSTRFSVNATGVNFVEAYPALSRAASTYFGTHLDDLTKTKTHFGEGEIDLGDLEIVESLDKKEDK